MSSCLSGGGRAYGFELEIVKSPSTSSITSHSSSPSSTLSESSNSPLAISTRKPRTPRKRPNQTYNEAATLLSTAYPKIFSTKHLTKPCKFTKPLDSFFNESPEVLLPFRAIDNSCFLLHQPIEEKRMMSFQMEPKAVNSREKSCHSSVGNEWNSNFGELGSGIEDDFDAESILDEEIGDGIDSIMGNLSVANGESNANCYSAQTSSTNSCYGLPLGLGFGRNFDFGFGMRRGVKALRNVDEGDWWKFPTVDVRDIAPKITRVSAEKKKKKKIEMPTELPKESPKEDNARAKSSPGLLLKLNYDDVLNAWSDRESPFSDEVRASGVADVNARLAQIDLFSESGGLREASVLRYKEKRRTRLFSRKIRYQVRKVNADRRPRMKGRFVRRSNSPISEE